MGWASAGAIFGKVADGLIKADASDVLLRDVLGDLIAALQAEDWDTEEASLAEFAEYPAIVAAFRDNNVIIVCDDEPGAEGDGYCSLERGHDDDHEDEDGNQWAQTGDAG